MKKYSLVLAACAGLFGCVDLTQAPDAAQFNGISPTGFGDVTDVTVPPAIYPVPTQADLVVAGGTYPVRRVAADRILIGFSGMYVERPDGTEELVPAPPSFTTEPSIRVGGTDDKLLAVLVVSAFCNQPVPDGDTLYLWGDEVVMRATDTREWQFTGMC